MTMTKLLKPIKAPNEQISFGDPRIKYPMLSSYKLDGFRALIINGEIYSPALKRYANRTVNSHFAEILNYTRTTGSVFDGEIWNPGLTFNQLSSRLRSHNGDLFGCTFYMFDYLTKDEWEGWLPTQFFYRYDNCRKYDFCAYKFNLALVKQFFCHNAQAAQLHYEQALEDGFEGTILRDPCGEYKHGRCTIKQSNMLKFKPFTTIDGNIIKVFQRKKLKENHVRTYGPANVLQRDYKKDSYILVDAVGSVLVQLEDGRTCHAAFGKGFSYQTKRTFWHSRQDLIGRGVELKYMAYGEKDKPRIGTIIRFRQDKDKII